MFWKSHWSLSLANYTDRVDTIYLCEIIVFFNPHPYRRNFRIIARCCCFYAVAPDRSYTSVSKGHRTFHDLFDTQMNVEGRWVWIHHSESRFAKLGMRCEFSEGGGKRPWGQSIHCCYIKRIITYTAAVDDGMTWLPNKLTLFPLSVNDFEHCSSYFLRGVW